MDTKSLFKSYIYPIAVFSGGMVGVGFLSLPYVAMRSGIWLALVYLLAISAVILLINLIFCDISLKTPDYKRFPGFVGYHLGKWPKIFIIITTTLGSFGVLLAYLIVAHDFLAAALGPFFLCNGPLCILVYFILASAIIYFDIKIVAKVELWVLFLLVLSIIFIFVEGFSHMKISNFFAQNSGFSLQNLFLPYGPLLFALWGTGMIPEVEEMLRGEKKNLKRSIVISTIAVAFFYLIFILLVLSITGSQTDQVALIGLKNILKDGIVFVALSVGVLATFIAFITQGLLLKKSLIFDLGIKGWQAFVIACFTPLILYFFGLRSFIPLLSLIGGVFLGINGIMILLMYKKIGGKKAIIYPLSLIFLLGVIYEIVFFFK